MMPYCLMGYVPYLYLPADSPSEVCTCPEGPLPLWMEALGACAGLTGLGPPSASLTCVSQPCNGPRSVGHACKCL